MKKSIIKIEYDKHIKNKKELITQLKSLKFEASLMMAHGEVFVKDFHALSITINYLKEVLQDA